jgi:hypothetical protein
LNELLLGIKVNNASRDRNSPLTVVKSPPVKILMGFDPLVGFSTTILWQGPSSEKLNEPSRASGLPELDVNIASLPREALPTAVKSPPRIKLALDEKLDDTRPIARTGPFNNKLDPTIDPEDAENSAKYPRIAPPAVVKSPPTYRTLLKEPGARSALTVAFAPPLKLLLLSRPVLSRAANRPLAEPL